MLCCNAWSDKLLVQQWQDAVQPCLSPSPSAKNINSSFTQAKALCCCRVLGKSQITSHTQIFPKDLAKSQIPIFPKIPITHFPEIPNLPNQISNLPWKQMFKYLTKRWHGNIWCTANILAYNHTWHTSDNHSTWTASLSRLVQCSFFVRLHLKEMFFAWVTSVSLSQTTNPLVSSKQSYLYSQRPPGANRIQKTLLGPQVCSVISLGSIQQSPRR